MKKLAILLTILAVLSWLGSAMGLTLGTNITIYDKRSGATTVWYGQQEDNEVEPGMVQTQEWDLEGFFLNGSALSMVGGFNFRDGVNYDDYTYTSGDIFLDVNGDANYGDSGSSLRNGYDYVIDLDFSSFKYYVYEITDTTALQDVYWYNSYESSPWQYDHTKNLDDQAVASGDFDFLQDLSDLATGFQGGYHYAVTGIELSFLPAGTQFISHFTMECGNDNLMGKGTAPVPEPATMLLFGIGLCGLAVVGRKKLVKQG